MHGILKATETRSLFKGSQDLDPLAKSGLVSPFSQLYVIWSLFSHDFRQVLTMQIEPDQAPRGPKVDSFSKYTQYFVYDISWFNMDI